LKCLGFFFFEDKDPLNYATFCVKGYSGQGANKDIYS